MNNRSGGPRSFNTIKRSNRTDRLRRRRQARMILLAMCAVILLLALTGLIFLVCHIAVSLKDPATTDPSQSGNPPPNNSGVIYQMQTKRYEDIFTGELIVVNLSHEYHFPSVEHLEKITEGRQTVNGTLSYNVRNITNPPKMQMSAAAALNQMMAQYFTIDGSRLTAYEAYRTYEQQEGKKTPAGKSEHHTGLLVAISNDETASSLDLVRHRWLLDNCHRYGFIQRYPNAKSGITGISYDYTEAFRYVGLPHATYISANNLCLEEYVELLKNNHTSQNGTDGKHLAIDTDQNGAADYEVYYVPASTGAGALTTVPIPTNYSYTVSGDNIGGFIVTVNLNAPKTAE